MEEYTGETYPDGLGYGKVAVWDTSVLFVVASSRAPHLCIDGGRPLTMQSVPHSRYWFRLEHVQPGRLHSYRFGLGGEWTAWADFASYSPDSYEMESARRGSLSDKRTVHSRSYPGASTDYWVYANNGIDERRGAPLMVWHDGNSQATTSDLFAGTRMQIVTDNLAHLGLMPPMVHLLVAPSAAGEEVDRYPTRERPTRMRSLQYDAVSARFGHYLIDEVIPHAEKCVKIRADSYSRGAAGISSGGISSFNLAWFHPERFSRVHSVVGSFTGLQWAVDENLTGGFMFPHMVRRDPARNIRVWLSGGTNDHEIGVHGNRDLFLAGSWPLNNIAMANALKLRGYDFHFRFGDCHHGSAQEALDLPESLAWLWRDYDPERTRQTFEQEPSERAKPVYRVAVSNRDSR